MFLFHSFRTQAISETSHIRSCWTSTMKDLKAEVRIFNFDIPVTQFSSKYNLERDWKQFPCSWCIKIGSSNYLTPHQRSTVVLFAASQSAPQFDGIRQNGLWWPNPCSTSLNSVLSLIDSTQIYCRMAMASEWGIFHVARTFSSDKYIYFSTQASASLNWWHQPKWLAQAILSTMRNSPPLAVYELW